METCLCDSMEELIYSPNPWNQDIYQFEKLVPYMEKKE